MKKLVTTVFVVLMLAFTTACTGTTATAPVPVGANTSADARHILSEDDLAACRDVLERNVPGAADQVIIVNDKTGSVADMPSPDGLAADLHRASMNDGSLTVIAVEGAGTAPRIVAKNAALSTPGPRDRPSVRRTADSMPACVQGIFLNGTLPTAPGTDLHRAMSLAAELAGPGTTIWLLSDMLANSGPLALNAGLLSMDPTEAAAKASSTAPLDLKGAALKVAGVGNSTTSLLSPQRTWLRDFSRGLCTQWRASGCDDINLDPVNPERADKNLPEDTLPPFPKITTTSTAGSCTFEVPAELAFAKDSPVLSDGAKEALARPLEMLLRNPAATAKIVGHTATVLSSPDHGVGFSERRASATMTYLTDSGVPASRITSRGVGDTEPKVEDIDPTTGQQIDEMAAIERRVNILIEGVPCSH
ncbi:OmpA family protein [Paenarthrobacter sp. NPDC089675]|uniref:OmpA family protein n=1 Tax=Paenarthrobacter TaxID=1742992 RepID=UPI00382103B2